MRGDIKTKTLFEMVKKSIGWTFGLQFVGLGLRTNNILRKIFCDVLVPSK